MNARASANYLLILSVLALVGCTTNASLKNPEETNYIAVDKYSAGLIYKIFQGGMDGCRVSSHNMVLGESTIEMNEKGKCTIIVDGISD